MKKLLLILFLFASCHFAKSNDTLKFVDLENQIRQLQTENQILKDKVTIIDNANNKFLTVTYSTIGFCLMIILGISIWNGYSNTRLDKKRFENLAKEIRLETNKNLTDDIDKKIDWKIESKLSNQFEKIKEIEQQNVKLGISILKKTNKLLANKEITDDFEASIEYLKLANRLNKINNIFDYELKQALRNIKELLNNDKHWIDSQIDEISNILPEIDKNYERYVNDIKTILKIN